MHVLLHSVPPALQEATTDPHLHWRLLDTHREVWFSLLHSICQQIWKTQQWPQDWKRSVFIPSQRNPISKNAQTTAQLHSSQSVSSVTQSCPTLCDPMNCSTPGLPVHHQLLEFTQTHVHRVGDAIQPSHPLSSPFPPAPNPSQHWSLFQ